jgi:hypothetical protein
MRNLLFLLIAAWAAQHLAGQTRVNGGRAILGTWDASGALSTRPAKTGSTLPPNCAAGEQFFNTGAAAGRNLYLCSPANTWTPVAASISIGLAAPPEFSVSGSPLTGPGTLTLTKTVQSANQVYAGPTSGGSALPAFRALVPSDLPAGYPYASLSGAPVIPGSSGQALTSNGSGGFGTAVSLAPSATTDATNAGNIGAGTLAAARLPANLRARGIGYSFDGGGSALVQGRTGYFTVPFACTISAWNATVDTGTITFDVWKVPGGSAIPTAGNSITSLAPPAIASGTAARSTALTGWSTAVTANDIFGVQVKSVSGATLASLVMECDQ